jgi:hypothetical protein
MAWVVVLLLVVVLVPCAIFGARLGRRLGTPPGAAPAKVERRMWVVLGAMLAISLLFGVWLLWAIEHHHAALGILVLVGVYFGFHFGLLALRYRRHRRRASE